MTTSPSHKAILQSALQHPQEYIRQRAQIILLTLEDADVETIAEKVAVSPRTVQKWQNAWEKEGIGIFPPEVAESNPVEEPTTRIAVSLVETPGIAPTNAMWEAGRKLLFYNLVAMIHQEPIARLGEDIEGVHKMRVAIRRMRSVFDVLGGYLDKKHYKGLKKSLRYSGRVLGQVRDLDVFWEKTQHYIDLALGGDAAPLQPLLDRLERRYNKARRGMLAWLDDEKFDRFIHDFYNRIETPHDMEPPQSLEAYRVDQVVPRLIYTCLETIRAYDSYLAAADLSTLHTLRIEFKRLRYLLEFFSEVLGESVEEVIKMIKKVQNHLGDLNDARVAVRLLNNISKGLDETEAAGMLAYRDVRHHEIETLQASFGQQWDLFNQHPVREALALAVAKL